MTSDQLRQFRTNRRLTATALAALLGVNRMTVARWEDGSRACPPMLALALAALAFDLPPYRPQ